jgi:hypothetical protein
VTFSGRFVDLERGAFGTTAAAHGRAGAEWDRPDGLSKYVSFEQNDTTGGTHLSMQNTKASTDQLLTATKVLDSPDYKMFIARMRIKKQSTAQRAGGIIVRAKANSSNVVTNGWYIEVRSSEKENKEIAICNVRPNGTPNRNTQKLFDCTIKEGETFELGVWDRPISNKKSAITVFINGDNVGKYEFADADAPPRTSKVAIAATGKSAINFNFFCAGTRNVTNDEYDSHMARMFENMFSQKSQLFDPLRVWYEGFDDYVRGIYIESAEFATKPALGVSKWFPAVNTKKTDKSQQGIWIAKSTDVAGSLDVVSPFRATYSVANTSDRPVVLSEDGQTIYPLIQGPVVEVSDDIEVNEKDDASIRAIGEKKYEASTQWIATEKVARGLAKWMLQVGKNGLETCQVSSFDNPLIEIGDIVTVYYPRKGMSGDKYVVTGISKSRSSGLQTDVTIAKLS